MAEIDDYKAFADFLSEVKVKLGKTQVELDREVGLGSRAWFSYTAYPAKERLPRIAEVYQVDLHELTLVYEKAKAGRKLETSFNIKKIDECVSRGNLNEAVTFDLPSAGRSSGRGHSFRNSG